MTRNEDAKPSLDEWVSSFYGIFGNADRQKTITDLCIRTARDVNAMFTAERRSLVARSRQEFLESEAKIEKV